MVSPSSLRIMKLWFILLLAATHPLEALFHSVAPSTDAALIVAMRPSSPEPQQRLKRVWLHRRVSYYSNSVATFQPCQLALAGDVEANPGPDGEPAQPQPALRPSSLLVSLQNARSLKPKLGDLRSAAAELSGFHLIAITETWLDSAVLDSELGAGLPEHTWFRRDRGSLGGGVACAVLSSLQPTRLPDPAGSELLLLRLEAVSVTVAVCYRPPDDDPALIRLTEALEALPASSKILLVGDFNIPEVQWQRRAGQALPVLTRRSGRACRFLDSCGLLGLKQWVYEPTRGPNLLDLVLTRDLTCRASVRDGWLSSDHREVVATVEVPGCRPPVITRSSVLNYKRADFAGLRRCLSLLPWTVLDDMEVNEAVDIFYSMLEAAVSDYIPRVTLSRRFPPWFSATARGALRAKEAAFRRLRRNPTAETREDFSRKRKYFKDASAQCYSDYLCSLVENFKTNPKKYWSFLKCFNRKGSVSPVLRDGTRLVTEDSSRASLLNDAFASKFCDPTVTVYPHAPDYDIPAFNNVRVSQDKVHLILKSINASKACGPDNLSARIIHECAGELSVPVSKLCALSLRRGVFPKRWKQANIVPIFKKGDKKAPDNYRSVSLLPLFGKVLERVVYDEMLCHVSPVLSEVQHGFLPRRSCVSNLATYLHHAWTSISERCQTDVIYTDFSAAFQSVNHKLLVFKLKNSYHVSGVILDWFDSYLSEREQRVVVNGKTSEWRTVTSGVPEGALLAPLLFALYINDLPMAVKQSHCVMFADDVKLYHRVRSTFDCGELQSDLDSLSRWSADWMLRLNPAKCFAFTLTLKTSPVHHPYSIGGSVLERVSEVRDLGVILDTKLNFSAHINQTISKANRALGVLIRSFQTGLPHKKFCKKTLQATYFANVRSILEYGCVIWGGAAKSHVERLERVQHRFLMWLASRSNTVVSSLAYEDLLRTFNVPTLKARRQQYDLVFLRNIYRGQVDSPYLLNSFPLHVPSRATRSLSLFQTPYARVNTVKTGLFCRLAEEMNSFTRLVPEVDIFSTTLGSFKNLVKKYVSDAVIGSL